MSSTERDVQPVAIVSVDPTARQAMALTRIKTEIMIDCRFATGESIVTPAVGEQWYVERYENVWRLYGRIPFNDPTLLIEPAEGQVLLGSAKGPTELSGTVINAHAPVTLKVAHAAGQRPDPATLAVGTMIYDALTSRPIFSDGQVWRDAMGTVI